MMNSDGDAELSGIINQPLSDTTCNGIISQVSCWRPKSPIYPQRSPLTTIPCQEYGTPCSTIDHLRRIIDHNQEKHTIPGTWYAPELYLMQNTRGLDRGGLTPALVPGMPVMT